MKYYKSYLSLDMLLLKIFSELGKSEDDDKLLNLILKPSVRQITGRMILAIQVAMQVKLEVVHPKIVMKAKEQH